MQGLNTIANRRQHPFDLVVTALADGQVDQLVVVYTNFGGSGLCGFTVQHDSLLKRPAGLFRDSLSQPDPIAFAAFPPGGCDRVGPLAITGQQQQASGVLVQPPGDMNPTGQAAGQQVECRWLAAVGGGTEHSGGFMHHQVDIAGWVNRFSIKMNGLFGLHLAIGLPAGFAIHLHSSR